MMRHRRLASLACWVMAAGACESIGSVVSVDDTNTVEVLGSGSLVVESRTLGRFDAVHASGGFQVIVDQAESDEVEFTTDDNLAALMRTDVIDGTLIVRPGLNLRLLPTEPLVIRVRAAGGVSGLRADGAIVLSADVGSQTELAVGASGASVMTVTGAVGRQVIDVSGASVYRGLELESDRTLVSASGASLIEIWAHDRLDVTASGAAVIRYRGHPTVNAQVTGGSAVTPVG